MTVQPPHNARPGTTRRAVIRTAGHTAWAAPVIIAATTAPAFAASGAAAITTVIGGARSGTLGDTLTITTTLTNSNTGAGGATTLVVQATPTTVTTINGGAPTNVTAGWTFAGEDGTPDSRIYTFTRPDIEGAATPAGTSTTPLAFDVTLTLGTIFSGDLTATPSVTSGTASGGSGSWA